MKAKDIIERYNYIKQRLYWLGELLVIIKNNVHFSSQEKFYKEFIDKQMEEWIEEMRKLNELQLR